MWGSRRNLNLKNKGQPGTYKLEEMIFFEDFASLIFIVVKKIKK